MQQEQISYASCMWDNIQTILTQSYDNRRLIEDIAHIFVDRAKAEEKYAHALEKVAASFQKLASKSRQISIPLELFVTQFATKAQLSKGYAEQIHEDIVPTLRALVHQQGLSVKPVLDDCKKWDREIQDLQNTLAKNSAHFKQKKREHEQQAVLNVIFDICTEYTDDKRQKQNTKVQFIQNELTDAERVYQQNIKDNNAYFDRESKNLTEALNKMQQQELERIYTIKDVLVKNIIYETSLQKNITYDYERIAERVNEFNPEATLQEFLNVIRQGSTNTIHKEFQELRSFISNSLVQMSQRNDFYFLGLAKELQIETLVEDCLSEKPSNEVGEVGLHLMERTREVCEFAERAWNAQDITFKEIQERFGYSPLKRRIFSIYLTKKRLMATTQLNEDQLQGLKTMILALIELASLSSKKKQDQ